ncbi:MAG: response regulator [Bacteroidota bacterium]
MKKIAIFENDLFAIKKTFEAINILYFNKELEFDFFETSQRIGGLSNLNNYDVVIIDIELARTSEMDGFQILEKIKELNISTANIILLTGHNNVGEKLKDMNLEHIPIVRKTIDIKVLRDRIKQVLNP